MIRRGNLRLYVATAQRAEKTSINPIIGRPNASFFRMAHGIVGIKAITKYGAIFDQRTASRSRCRQSKGIKSTLSERMVANGLAHALGRCNHRQYHKE